MKHQHSRRSRSSWDRTNVRDRDRVLEACGAGEEAQTELRRSSIEQVRNREVRGEFLGPAGHGSIRP
ncbi:MAG: hypothetical protein HY650_12545 [Acidobacteria bacterium]|nr:hypothetical protein [Acidobacteriota bacterium]